MGKPSAVPRSHGFQDRRVEDAAGEPPPQTQRERGARSGRRDDPDPERPADRGAGAPGSAGADRLRDEPHDRSVEAQLGDQAPDDHKREGQEVAPVLGRGQEASEERVDRDPQHDADHSGEKHPRGASQKPASHRRKYRGVDRCVDRCVDRSRGKLRRVKWFHGCGRSTREGMRVSLAYAEWPDRHGAGLRGYVMHLTQPSVGWSPSFRKDLSPSPMADPPGELPLRWMVGEMPPATVVRIRSPHTEETDLRPVIPKRLEPP